MSREYMIDYIRAKLEQASDRILGIVYWFVHGLTEEKV